MTAVIPFGTFKQVPVREAWPREDETSRLGSRKLKLSRSLAKR